MGARIGLYRVLVGKSKEKRPLGRPSFRDENLQKVGCGVMY